MRQHVQRAITSQHGTSLVEVLMAVAVLSIVVVGAISLFAQSSILTTMLKEQVIVNNALNERMEEIRNMPYSTITGLGSSFTTSGFNQLDNASGTLSLQDAFSDADIRKVNVVISWTSVQGRPVSKGLSAYITNNGINKQ